MVPSLNTIVRVSRADQPLPEAFAIRGKLTEAGFQASEMNLAEFIKTRGNTKPHLADLVL